MAMKPQGVAVFLLFLFISSALGQSGQVIFSRRIYLEHGVSYQQIWSWNPSNGALRAMTHSPLDHYQPLCKGSMIQFTSPSEEDSYPPRVKVWHLNPVTGSETVIGPVPKDKNEEESASEKPGCDVFARHGDLDACGSDKTLVVSRSGREIGRFRISSVGCLIDKQGTIGDCETPIRTLDWSGDGNWLLIGEEGVEDSSSSRQNDYSLLNLMTMQRNTVASAETAFWIPGSNRIVYLTPRDLAPLPGSARKHSVWVQQLMLFDPLQKKAHAITTGLASNVDPAWCTSIR